MNTNKQGFTLIELLVTIAVIGILAAIVLTSANSVNIKSQMPQNAIEESNEVTKEISRSVPVPDLSTSSERKNVARRAELFDNEDKVSYVYLVSYGKVMAFYSVTGKVSSLRSYMTPVDKLVRGDGDDCYYSSSNCYVVESPDIDGTYGENVDGIFFFTTEGAYVEWKGEYMMSDQPLQLTTTPALVRTVK